MERIVAPNGSQINMESLVDSIQEKAFLNLKKRLEGFFSTYGLNLTVTNGVLGAAFGLSFASGTANITVAEGTALTEALNYLKISSPISTSNLTVANPNNGYGIVLTYVETSSSPVKAVNAFVYDKLGSTASLNRKTVFSDSLTLSLVQITSNITALKASLTENQILIGAVWNTAGTFNTTTAGLSGYTPISSGTYRIADLRLENSNVFNFELIPDSKVLYKDRPSTGDYKFNQNIEFGQNIDISGTQTFSSPGGVDYTLTPTESKVVASSSTGTHFELYQDGGVSKTKVHNLVSDQIIKVKVGEEYRDVVVSGPPSTVPRNFRIFDIYPTEDRNESKGFVEVRWNWDDLEIVTANSTSVTIKNISYSKEAVAFEEVDRTTFLPEKQLYFNNSGNFYSIISVVQSGPNWVITVDGNPSAEITSEASPAVICDNRVEYYKLRFISNSAIFTAGKRKTKETLNFELLNEYVTSPSFVTKLELGRLWTCTIQPINNTHFGTIVTMADGEYDPDHAPDGQNVIEYESPFEMKLPYIAGEAGVLNLEAHPQGFNFRIGGWIPVDSQDVQNTPHEFEILWSDTTILNIGSFNNPVAAGAQRMVIDRVRSGTVAVGLPTQYSVGIRPLQNKQPVADPIFGTVVSGGGGVLPTEVTLVDQAVDLNVTYLRKYYDDPTLINSGPGNFTAHVVGSLGMLSGGQEYVDPNTLAGKQVVVPTDSGNLFYGLGDLEFFQPVSNGLVSIPAASAPRPRILSWTSAGTGTTGTYANDATWGKAVFTPNSSAGVYETVAAGASVEFTATICFPNVAKTEARFKLVNNATNAVLKTITVKKETYYPPYSDEFTHRVSLSWINNTLSAVKVRIEVLVWGDFASYAPSDLTYAAIMYDFHPGFTVGHFNLGTFGSYNLPVNFGRALPTIYKISDALTDASSHSTIIYSKYQGHYSGPGFLYAVKINPDPGLIPGNTLVLGATKASRLITEKKLSVEYEITRIDFVCSQTENVSQNNPAYIRVYPADSEASAAFLEVPSTGTLTAENLKLKIKRDINSEIKFKVDAYDPSPSGTNNFTEISGKLTVRGKPIVSNKLA